MCRVIRTQEHRYLQEAAAVAGPILGRTHLNPTQTHHVGVQPSLETINWIGVYNSWWKAIPQVNNSVSKPILFCIFLEFELVQLETIRSYYAFFFHFEYLAYITLVYPLLPLKNLYLISSTSASLSLSSEFKPNAFSLSGYSKCLTLCIIFCHSSLYWF